MSVQIVDPKRKFEVAGQVCPLKSAYVGFAPGANQTAIAAVTDKIIRVMGLYVVPSGAGNPTIALLNGSGGAIRFATTLPANTVGPVFLPVEESGYFETSSGVGLFATTTVANIDLTLFYIEY